MKKSKLVAGILLMILGIGVLAAAFVFCHPGYGRYGIMNPQHNLSKWNDMRDHGKVKPNQNQGQNSGTKTQLNQNQNDGQSTGGGA